MHIDAPSFNYDQPGLRYAGHRRTDPRIAARVHAVMAEARTILNIGAGAGSYEPDDRYVVAIEPSAAMRAQRQEQGKVPAIAGSAGSLPFDDGAFDASMAMVTIHHWPDIEAGLRELRRVSRGPVVIMTFDPEALNSFWNAHYFPELIAVEKQRYPAIGSITDCLGGSCEVQKIPVPLDCTDGFQEAFYGRPEAFLNPEVRRAQSAWGFLPQGLEDELVTRLAGDLASGAWDRKYGVFRRMPDFTCALRLIVGRP